MWIDTLIVEATGERLTALQSVILQQVWQGQKYAEIVVYYGCTEGHIALLDQIGARCDLAEAYWQSSLTYQQMGKVVVAQTRRDRAIHLFTEIAAPK